MPSSPSPVPLTLEQALRAVYASVEAADAETWRAKGWTAEAVQAVAALAAWAAEKQTGLSLPLEARSLASQARRARVARRDEETSRRIAREMLMARYQRLVHEEDVPPGEALAWMSAYCGARTQEAVDDLDALIADTPEGRARWAQWRAVGPLGPLAWAAGLDADEARTQIAEEAVSVVDLLTLAALRGFRLPPLNAAPALRA